MEKEQKRASKYIIEKSRDTLFRRCAYVFIFTLFVLPQYFGLPTPGFDLTALRIMQVVMCFLIIMNTSSVKEVTDIITGCTQTKFVGLYFIVLVYTTVLRANVNTFLNPFLEFVSFYLLIYILKKWISVERFVTFIMMLTYLLCFLGLIEYVMGRSPFSYLETISGLYTGAFYRSGNYRIMGPCNHSLAYGLLLITATPFACWDRKANAINILQNKVLLILIAANVLLNGSRSTLGVFVLEIFILFLFSGKENQRKIILLVAAIIPIALIAMALFYNTSVVQYILMQITSIIDEILGTSYAANYGADVTRLDSSSNYRAAIPKIFTLDWLNPLLGRGRKGSFSAEIDGSFIHSVDNFYVAEYIRYAYPGLVTYVLFIGSVVIGMIKNGIKEKNALYICTFVGALCYFINLWWLDSLQTLKYVYILFAVYCAEQLGQDVKGCDEKKHKSKYIR